MVILFAIYVLVCLYGVKIAVKPQNGTSAESGFLFDREHTWHDYISPQKTTSIKGLFVILVFFSHYSPYFIHTGTDAVLYEKIAEFGQLMVVMFLFCSGYGVMESAQKKGMNYTVNMPVQRILKLIADYDVAMMLFIIMNTCYGKSYSLKHILLSFIDLADVGNGNWYLFAVICTYVFSFAALMVSKNNKHISASIVTVLCLVYIIVVQAYREYWWFDTILCYAFGMCFSVFRDIFEKIVQRNILSWLICLCISGAGFVFCFIRQNVNFVFHEASCFLMIIFILILTMKVSVDNVIINKAGKMIFGIYVLQRIPLTILYNAGITTAHPYIGFVVSLAVTVGLALLYSKYMGFTAKIFKKSAIKIQD